MNEDSIKEEMTITDLKKVHFEQKDWPLTTIKENCVKSVIRT